MAERKTYAGLCTLAAAALMLGANMPQTANAKPKRGDVYYYYDSKGNCHEDTWEPEEEGGGFMPAGGWGHCPRIKPNDHPPVKKETRARANPQ